ncbi:uncharacterized protein [Pleurodeles waltl]|uniref:uncharacterized protein isoform X2 n=1 Tax=Pleurodeles waltl TaxID=8319 RepID=UPI00370948BC
MSLVGEMDLERGPPDPRTVGEKPQCQGGGFTLPVCDTDWETGTPLYKEDRFIRGGPCGSTDSGYSEGGSSPSGTDSVISDAPRARTETGGLDSSGASLGAIDGSGREGQMGGGLLSVQRDRGERRDSGGLHQATERGEDAESGGEMLEGRESPGRREALKEGSGTEGQRGEIDRGERRDSGGLHQDTERGGDAESGGEMLEGRGSPGRREALKEGSGTEGQWWEGDRRERRDSGLGFHQDTERGGDAESGDEMLEGRGSPDKELLKEGSVTEDHTSIRRRPQVPLKTSSGEEETRGRKRLPPTGRFSSQDIPVPPHLEPCPMDWLHSRNKCYYFSTMYKEEGDWDESQKFCSSHNGSLALFDNEEQLNFLMDISRGDHVWVGLRKSEDGIHWANGTACSSSLCSITDFGECVFIGLRALWLSACHLPRPYICSKEPNV